MNDTLQAMIALQQMDTRLQALEQRAKAGPSRLAEFDKKIDEVRGEYLKSAKDQEMRRRQHRELEVDVKALEDRLRIAEERLQGIKNNIEYQAMLKEIAHMKATMSNRESDYLALGEAIEEFSAPLAEREKAANEKAEALLAEKAEIEKEVAATEAELAARRKERDPYLEKIPARLQKTYEDLRTIRKGIAVVGSFQNVCQGCHMSLPPHTYNMIIPGDELIQCPSCKRFLYYNPPMKVEQVIPRA